MDKYVARIFFFGPAGRPVAVINRTGTDAVFHDGFEREFPDPDATPTDAGQLGWHMDCGAHGDFDQVEFMTASEAEKRGLRLCKKCAHGNELSLEHQTGNRYLVESKSDGTEIGLVELEEGNEEIWKIAGLSDALVEIYDFACQHPIFTDVRAHFADRYEFRPVASGYKYDLR